VRVDYVGSFETGTVFDTSIAAAAQAAGIYTLSREYAPLNITLGQGQVIPGFEDAIAGMRKGETKTITVPPARGYGAYDPLKVTTIGLDKSAERTIVIERTLSVPTKAFLASHPDAAKGSTVTSGATNYTVEEMGLENVTLRLDAQPGDRLRLPGTFWDSAVVSVGQTNVTLRQDPAENSTVMLPVGPAKVTVDAASVHLHLLLGVGDQLRAQVGTGVVTAVNATAATVDFNHPLAGKTLVFKLTLVGIARPKK
jgi:FKBP-type peptidyl-prolyl cis-trans isomerase 2